MMISMNNSNLSHNLMRIHKTKKRRIKFPTNNPKFQKCQPNKKIKKVVIEKRIFSLSNKNNRANSKKQHKPKQYGLEWEPLK